jgi:hypothetical protein
VVAAGPSARVTVLPAVEQAPLDTAVHFVVPVVDVTTLLADRPNFLVAPAAPPLFVCHCALLI